MIKKIGTHSGSFHCDEVMACFLLRKTHEFANAEIVRTRDKAVLDTLDIIVDVGDEFDPRRNRFDHHQKSFQDTFGGRFNNVRLSSAGLIWKFFGKEVIRNLSRISEETIIETIHKKLYSDLFQSLDAVDNGISQHSTEVPERYREVTNLSARVGRQNPSWLEEDPDFDKCFYKALDIVGRDFTEIFESAVNEWLPARTLIEKYLMDAGEVDNSKKIMKLEKFCPWKEHLFELEEELSCEKIFYVLYFDSSKNWKIQAVGLPGVAFGLRLPLPEPWRGKRGNELGEISGISDIEFVHATGFIGGAKTYESVLKMARISLGLI